MPLTQFELALRPIARERISKGHLPRKVRSTLWGGNGTGELCALCDKTILPSEVELEVEALVNGTLQTLRFHVICETAWQLECARDDYLKQAPIGSARASGADAPSVRCVQAPPRE